MLRKDPLQSFGAQGRTRSRRRGARSSFRFCSPRDEQRRRLAQRSQPARSSFPLSIAGRHALRWRRTSLRAILHLLSKAWLCRLEGASSN